MSEPPPLPVPDDLSAWLQGLGPAAVTLAWVNPDTDPLGPAHPPVPGRAGIERPGFNLARLAVEEVVADGPLAALRRWTHLDDGQRQLVILAAGEPEGSVREYTPGELARDLLDGEGPELAKVLSTWLVRRQSGAPQGLELGWVAAAAAWTCHMRDLAGSPPETVLTQAMASAGEPDELTGELVVSTAVELGQLFDRLERGLRSRDDLVEGWLLVDSLALDVPLLKESADWLLDQIALRDAGAQRLRAVLEPDIADHRLDLTVAAGPGALRPVLDAQRAAQLQLAREIVREYTAAAYDGRTSAAAEQIAGTIAIPERSLTTTGPARAWRDVSFTAHGSVSELAVQRGQAFAQDNISDPVAQPELVHATNAYFNARAAQLDLIHDALGRLSRPPMPGLLPDALAEMAASQTAARVAQTFGSLDRACEFLDGQIAYLQQQPVPPHRSTGTPAEVVRLQAVRDRLDRLAQPSPLDAGSIRQRVEAAMERPAVAAAPAPAAPRGAPADRAHTPHPAPGTPSPGVRM